MDPELVQDGQFLAMYVDDVITTGTNHVDTLNGSAAAETFNGKAGADTINAGSGDDTLLGAGGNDTLNGGAGEDILTGHAGADVLNGGTGNDLLNGLNGDDVLNGDAGNNTLRGAAGDDVLTGGLGRDLLVGGLGADTFVFAAEDSLDASRDRIQGFSHAEGDLINLSAPGVTFPDLYVVEMAPALYAVAANLDGNPGYDFVLMVQSNTTLTSADFVL